MMSKSHATQPTADAHVVGRRRIFYFNDTGQPAYRVYDLTADNFMNPTPGDEFFHGPDHDQMLRRIGAMLRHHHRFSPTLTVHLHPKLIWADPTLAQPMPDIVVVSDLTEPLTHRPVLDLATEGATMRAVIEITSPRLVEQDYGAKARVYAQAGVPEYWIIDLGQRVTAPDRPLCILGYRLEDGDYHAIPADTEGKWQSHALRVWFQVADGDLQIGDLRTGKPFPPPSDDDDPTIATQAEAARRAQSIAGQLNFSD
jgi:Uma2 family endonuclease